MMPELHSAINSVTGITNKDIIPRRLVLDQASVFALLNFRFKIYKRLSIAVEGTVVPTKNPVYYGMLSFTIDGDK
jgi:hypothetical protein